MCVFLFFVCFFFKYGPRAFRESANLSAVFVCEVANEGVRKECIEAFDVEKNDRQKWRFFSSFRPVSRLSSISFIFVYSCHIFDEQFWWIIKHSTLKTRIFQKQYTTIYVFFTRKG